MFKRRNRQSYQQAAQNLIYPRGGWRRAGRYLMHRLRRLPDAPHRIGRGLAAGVFVSFTPLVGAHVLLALGAAWAARGNILAAVIGTIVGNPLTLPFIAVASVGLGRRLLGIDGQLGPQTIIGAITRAAGETAGNLVVVASGGEAHWPHLSAVWEGILMPYLAGGTILGLIAAVATHYLSVPLILAYQRRKAERRRARVQSTPK